jgi:hypothetical protein
VEAARAAEQVLGAACAACGAGMRPGAPWCTLCLAPVATAPAPADDPLRVEPLRSEPDPLTAPLHQLLGGVSDAPGADAGRGEPAPVGWPCTTCDSTNALDEAVCRACGEPFLAGLSGAGSAGRLPVVGDLRALSPAQRGLLGIVVGLVAMGLVSVLVVLVGLLG